MASASANWTQIRAFVATGVASGLTRDSASSARYDEYKRWMVRDTRQQRRRLFLVLQPQRLDRHRANLHRPIARRLLLLRLLPAWRCLPR